MENDRSLCPRCHKPAMVMRYVDGDFVCLHCVVSDSGDSIHFVERGIENPSDPNGSTAHIRDIKDRRWHPTEKRMFYYSKEIGHHRKYFFPK